MAAAMTAQYVALRGDAEEDEEESTTGHACGACEYNIDFKEEIFLLRVHRIHATEQGVFLLDVVDKDGDYTYVPYFVCEECWTDDQEALMNTINGEPPVVVDQHLCQCDACGSSIMSGELVGLVESGELAPDEREPVGSGQAIQFKSGGFPFYLCTRCLCVLNVEVREYWATDVRHGNECPEGLDERCWRSGECQHVCKNERAWQWASENTT